MTTTTSTPVNTDHIQAAIDRLMEAGRIEVVTDDGKAAAAA